MRGVLKANGKIQLPHSLSVHSASFVAFTPATAVIIIVFSIAGLFCFVLCLVFEQAIRYKQENDLTI